MNRLGLFTLVLLTLLASSASCFGEDRTARDTRILAELAEVLGEKYRTKKPLPGDDLLHRLLPVFLNDKAIGAKAAGLCESVTTFVLKAKTKDSFNVSVRLYGTKSAEAAEELVGLFRGGEARYNAGVEKYQKVLVKKASDKLEVKGASKAYGYERVIEREKRGNIHRSLVVVAAGAFVVTVELGSAESLAPQALTTRVAVVALQSVRALPKK